jgi:hypothetical protein
VYAGSPNYNVTEGNINISKGRSISAFLDPDGLYGMHRTTVLGYKSTIAQFTT